jgi:molecular chaperone DnaK (HSP70)
MDEVSKEIRQMLLGNLVPKDKYLEVSENKLVGIQYGVADGADNIILLGIMRHTKYFKSELKANRIRDIGHKALMEIGRKVYLKSNPNAETAICRYLVTRPIVVLFEVDDFGIKVETYTARGIPGLISEWWIRRKFMKFMPKELEKVSKEEVFKKKRDDDMKERAEKKEKEEALKAEELAREEARKAEEEARKAAEEAEAALEKARKAKEEAEKAAQKAAKKLEEATKPKEPSMEEDFDYEAESDER